MPSSRRSDGFTLIELLVVMVVVGLLVTLATFTLGGNSLRRDMENEVRELYLLMQTVGEQAILNNSELGLILDEESYHFVIFDELTGEWKTSPEPMFRQRSVPDWLMITEYVENDLPRLASEEDRLAPDVVFFSSGETTPFELEFTLDDAGNPNDDYMQTILSDGVSQIEWVYPGQSEQ